MVCHPVARWWARPAALALAAGLALAAAPARAQPAAPDAGPEGAGEAQEELEAERLQLFFGENVQVSAPAARTEPLDLAAAPLVVITADDIRARGYRDLVDVLHDLPGVDYSTWVDGSLATAVLVNGIYANNKIVILRDGVPITFPSGSRFILGRNVPLYDVERIEVLYGPASVVYGADAYAAVIQLITRKPDKQPPLEVEGAGGSYDLLHGATRYLYDSHILGSAPVGPTRLTCSARTFQSNGPDLLPLYPGDLGAINQQPAPYTGLYQTPVRSWYADAALQVGDLTVGSTYTDHAWSTATGYNPSPPVSENFTQDATWHYRFFQAYARHEVQRGKLNFRTIVTYGNKTLANDSAYFNFGTVGYKYQEEESLRLDHRTAWSVADWLMLTGGGRAQALNVVPRSADLHAPASTRGNLTDEGLAHVIFDRFGVFGLAEVRPWEILTLNGGASLEYDGNSGQNVVLPRGGAVVRMFKGRAHLKALYGEAYVPPIPDDQYTSFTIPGAFIFLPNPGLRSERIRTGELLYDHQLSDTVQVQLGGYYNVATDLVQILDTGPVTVNGASYPDSERNVNLGTVRSYGGQAQLRYAPGSWLQLTANYALIYGTETLPVEDTTQTQTYPLAKVSHHKVLAGATARPWKWLVADLRLRWVSAIVTRVTNETYKGQPQPGYYDLNFNLRAEELWPGVDLDLWVQNLTDHRYYEFGLQEEEGVSGRGRTPQPPLTFLLGVTYRPFGSP